MSSVPPPVCAKRTGWPRCSATATGGTRYGATCTSSRATCPPPPRPTPRPPTGPRTPPSTTTWSARPPAREPPRRPAADDPAADGLGGAALTPAAGSSIVAPRPARHRGETAMPGSTRRTLIKRGAGVAGLAAVGGGAAAAPTASAAPAGLEGAAAGLPVGYPL